jgi:hypothetical protein
MREISDVEVQAAPDGMSVGDGLAAIGICLGAASVMAASPIVAGVASGAMMVYAGVDIAMNTFG